MKRLACFLLTITLCVFVLSASACTSFAVYSSTPLYGMNWDYPDTVAYLRLSEAEGYHKVFSFGFETEYGMATNGSMNDLGFAAFMQDLHPREAPTAALDDTSVQDMHDLALTSPFMHERVQELRDMLSNGMHVANRYHTLHDLFADAQGDAFVLEEYDGGNVMTPVHEGALVMTNFPNCQLDQVDFTKDEYELQHSSGFVGVDRYKIAHEIIDSNRDDFTIARGFEVLEKAAQHGLYRTRYSGIYDPLNQAVYVALERDYDHIWKISIAEDTVETYLGFGKDKLTFSYAELCEGDLGIPFEKLMSYAK